MATTPARSRKKNNHVNHRETERFEHRLNEILEHATNVFYEKGYDAASMRDLSRVSGMSLAGLYYYFESKERLLYLIQKHTFETVLRLLKDQLELLNDPEERIRVFIGNHLEYFLANRKAMTVLSHESETLTHEAGAEIRELKREYYRIGVTLVDEYREAAASANKISTRVAVLSLFGMMNWIYMWHLPRVDMDAPRLADQMFRLFLRGLCDSDTSVETKSSARSRR
jgi:AcrR family transcriptional regulator